MQGTVVSSAYWWNKTVNIGEALHKQRVSYDSQSMKLMISGQIYNIHYDLILFLHIKGKKSPD